MSGLVDLFPPGLADELCKIAAARVMAKKAESDQRVIPAPEVPEGHKSSRLGKAIVKIAACISESGGR
jgi:hypothetical protein